MNQTDNMKNVSKSKKNNLQADVVIVGTGVGGCFSALNLSEDLSIIMITKSDLESSDSFLAQGGICVLHDDDDYDSYFEDTMRAGHYENRKESVDIMIRGSQDVIHDLIGYGVDFAKEDGKLLYTREGAHSRPRILFHEDITGKEITSKLLAQIKTRKNIQIMEYTTMTDILISKGHVPGLRLKHPIIKRFISTPIRLFLQAVYRYRYKHSTNFSHLTGDALILQKAWHQTGTFRLCAASIQQHFILKKPTQILISESVRGEGALLYDKNGNRFIDELLPRDVVTKAIQEQMKKDGTDHVWLSLEKIPKEIILSHFPNIYQHCLEEGYDATKEWIPVVPAQHYFMGGIWVDSDSHTSMPNLYAVGETSCNGVHGKNRLASNSLLESLVFAKRAARGKSCLKNR